jgi:hypothetical protein
MNKKEFFETFPEAKAAYKAGTRWEYMPEYLDGGEDFYEFCLDCKEYPEGHWMSKSYHLGYEVEGKTITCLVWRQWDGDWDVIDSFALKNNSDDKWHDENYKDNVKSHVAYARWVAEKGEDPLGAYYVCKVERKQVTYKWRLYKHGDTFVVAASRKDGRKWVADPNPCNEVMMYCSPAHYTWKQVKALADKGTKRKDQIWSVGQGVIEICDTIHVTLTNADYATALKEVAARHIKQHEEK